MTALAPERLTGVWWSKKCPRTACNGRGLAPKGLASMQPKRTRHLGRPCRSCGLAFRAASRSPLGAVHTTTEGNDMAQQSVCDWCGHSIDGREIFLAPIGGFGRPWPYQDLHRDCLAAIVTVLADEDTPTAPKPNDALSRVQRESEAREQRHRECWRDIGTHERERLIIEAIADDALTASEVANTLSDTLGVPLYASHTRAALNALHATGQLAKATEIYRGKPRNRYRRPALDGPIADLQRALDDGVA